MNAADRSATTQALMNKLLQLLNDEQTPHAIAIDALANLANQVAASHSCCTAGAGLMFLELGAKLVFKGKGLPEQMPDAAPGGTHLH